MIRFTWNQVSRNMLVLGYVLVLGCSGGGDGSGGGANDENLVEKGLPWRIPHDSRPRIDPPDRTKPEIPEKDDLIVPEKILPDDVAPQQAEAELDRFRSQYVGWRECDDIVLSKEQRTLEMYRKVLGSNTLIQCAIVNAPMNYGAPERDGSADLKLLRISMGSPAGKRHLLFNPGGPSANGLITPLHFVSSTSLLSSNLTLGDVTPDPELVQLAKAMLDQYVFIGFSPRGSEEMLPVNVARGRQEPWTWTSDEAREEKRMENNTRAYAAAFASNKVAPFVHSDAVAQDMELIRRLVGDEQLHYYGISYGTKFGLWYAGRFPKTTGRMLLEAVVDYGGDPHVVYLQKSGPWLRNFLKQMPYLYSVMDSDKFFPKDRQDIDITKILEKLDVPLQYLVMDQLHTAAYRAASDSKVYDYLISLLLAAMYFQEGQSTDQRFSEDREIDRLIKAIIRRFGNLKSYAQYPPFTANYTKPYNEGLSAFWCNDAQTRSSPEALRAVLRKASGGHYLADIEDLDKPCAFWPFKRKPILKPTLESIHASGADSKMLLLNAQWDRATIMTGAKKTRQVLTDARFIKYLESTRHNFFPTKSTIVDGAVYRHFVHDRLPEKDIDAQGGSVFDELIGRNGGWRRDPEKIADRLPEDLFVDRIKPGFGH